MRHVLKSLLTLILLVSSIAFAATPLPPAFDPERHMLVSEVKPGMKGYGLSVFFGSKIDRFDVEVLSILRNFGPKSDVVLIRATGANLEHTGAIAGMSGSPIYLTDETGKSRLIGAFAYGWPMMKDPLAGVQPIEYMLTLPAEKQEFAAAGALPPAGKWSLLSTLAERRKALQTLGQDAVAPPLQLTRLAVPLSVSGMSASQSGQLSRLFVAAGLTPMQAGGGGDIDKQIKLEPGSVMAVPLLAGDIDMTAVGTCTEVLGGKAYGFGHPFTGTGPIELPMCAGEIQGVIANLVTSFKLGSASRAVGTLLSDESSGVAGRLGAAPPTAPIQWKVRYADGSLDRIYRFNAVIHPQFTPLLASAAAYGALSASRELPHYNTIDYRITIVFSDDRKVQLADRMVNVDPMSLFSAMGMPISVATENPFGRILVKSIEGEVEIKDGAATAELLHAGTSRQVYRPGETVKFFATLRPFRSLDVVRELEFVLPAEIPDGSYTLVVSELARFLADEQTASPFRFTAAKLDDIFSAINDLSSLRSDALHLRLMQNSPGVAVGRSSLPRLPGTHRQMLLASGRSDVVAYMPSTARHVPSDWVVSGAVELPIQVNRKGRSAGTKQPDQASLADK